MRFTELVLDDFRGFAGRQTIPLHPELTVLVGVNGAGKSSVLEAAASVLSCVVSIFGGSDQAWFAGGDTTNVHHGAESAFWKLLWTSEQTDHPQGVGLGAFFNVEQFLDLRKASNPRFWESLNRLRDNLSLPASQLPYLGFIHSSSTRPSIAHKAGVELTGRLLAYKAAFDPESIQFDALTGWFEQEENLENQEKIRGKSLSRDLPSLRAVRRAVSRFFSALRGAKLDHLSVIRTHGDNPLQPPRGRLAMKKEGHDLFIDQLSDGERRLLLLVADTARRMVVLNPRMEDPTQSEGLLLIDEIELHLHPQWQRTVIAALRSAFPKIQFLIATHAPAVLATVPNACVVVLDDGKVLPGSPHVFGRDPNDILVKVMDTPLLPDEVQKDLDALYSEIDQHPRKAKKRLQTLEQRLGADHPDLVRARALMQFMAG